MTTAAAARLYLAQHLMEHEGRPVVIFNPGGMPVEELPPIFAFSNVVGGGDGVAYAMAQDGTVLGSHWCSHELYVPADLAVIDSWMRERHDSYKGHYPNGYRMEFVRAADVKTHIGLTEAYRLNQERGPVSET